MNKLVLLFLGIFCWSNLTAQEVVMGAEMTKPPATVMSGLVYKDESGFVAQRTNASVHNNFPTLERYDVKLNLIAKAAVPLEYSKKVLDFEKTVDADGAIYVFSSFANQKNEKNYLFYQEIDVQSLTAKGSLATVCEVPLLTKFNKGNFNIVSSEDKSKILIFANTYYKKGEPERYKMQVHSNQGMVKLWEKEIKLPYEDQLFAIQDFTIDDDGVVYVLAQVFQETGWHKFKRNGEPNYHYVVYGYHHNSPDPIEYEIDLGDKFINDMTFKINDNNDLVVGGLISNKGLYTISGVCYFEVDKVTKAIKSRSQKEFGVDFMEKFMSGDKASKGKELFSYVLRRIITKKDGGAILLAEQYYERLVQYNTSSGTRSAIQYCYNHIFVTSIAPSGQIEWCIRVPKVQVTSNDNGFYSSFVSAVYGDKIYLVFNDNPVNLNVTESSKVLAYNGKNSVVVMVEVSPNGDYKKSLLFKNSEEGVILRPKVCIQEEVDEPLLLFGEIKKKYKFGWLNF